MKVGKPVAFWKSDHIREIVEGMTRQEFSRVCKTMPGSGRLARVTIKSHEFAEDDIAVILGLPSGEGLIFNTWEEFDDWFVQQYIHKRSHHGVKEHLER